MKTVKAAKKVKLAMTPPPIKEPTAGLITNLLLHNCVYAYILSPSSFVIM